MGRDERGELLRTIGALRGSEVIAYITSTRPGLEAPMAIDVIPFFHEHLRALPARADRHIDLFLHSNGGDGVVPWRLVTLAREFCSEFSVLVPNRAFSAATLTALGADEVVMHAMGMLGPTDPTVANEFNPPNPRSQGQVLGISVEDVTSYISLIKDEVGVRHEDELVQAFLALTQQVHPLALGNVKRSTSQSRMMGEKLLRARRKTQLADHEIGQIITRLTSELFYHGHPINRREARDDLGLTFVQDAEPKLEATMWDLFAEYDATMSLNEEFQPIDEAVAIAGLPDLPPFDQPPTIRQQNLGPVPLVFVESARRTDVLEMELQVTMRRDALGSLEGSVVRTARGWRTETEA